MQLDPVIDGLVQSLRAAPPPAVPEDRAAAEQGADFVFGQLGQPGPAVGEVRDCEIPTDSGPIRVRLYFPAGAGDGPFPGYVFLYGGAFWHGSVAMAGNDAACRERCTGGRCVVAAVDYRLVPEHPFPQALHDVYDAITWLVEHATELGVDPSRLAIGGASAGGNLAAALALMARDRGGPALSLQILEVPVLDLTFSAPCVEEQCAFLGMASAPLRQIADLYLAGAVNADSPYASPLFADDLTGLPPALILVSEHDPLRDDGERYAERLSRAGVTAVCVRYVGQIHSSPGLTGLVPAARVWREQVIAALTRLHGDAPWI